MKRVLRAIIILFAVIASIALFACNGNTEKKRLTAPQNIRTEGTTLIWDEVDNATGYVVSLKYVEYEVEECSYNLSALVTPGDYVIKILAVGDNKNFGDSEWSIFTYTVMEPEEHGYDESGLEYTLLEDRTGYEVSRGNHGLIGVVEMPDYYMGLPVKRIAEAAFMQKEGKTEPNPFTGALCNILTTGVRLPAYLESIGEKAFSCMINLREVVIPDTVTEIASYAFYGCISLKRVTLPKYLKVIPERCFANCALEEITFPQGLDEIKEGAFACGYYPTGMIHRTDQCFTAIEIPETVKRIGVSAFDGCLKLAEISLPEDLEYLDRYVFSQTEWYESQPDGFVMLGNILYGYKGGMEENAVIKIPSNVKKIAGGAFYNNKNITEVVIPDGAELIGTYIFAACSSLSRVSLPSNLTAIPDYAFSSCILEEIEIPNSVTDIAANAFRNCKVLEHIYLPSGLKTIGETAFLGCKALTEIVIPSSVESLGKNAFNSCDCLAAIYYDGTEDEWNELKKQFNISYINASGIVVLLSAPFSNAEIYYYSEKQPNSDGSYWHYDDENGSPVIW